MWRDLNSCQGGGSEILKTAYFKHVSTKMPYKMDSMVKKGVNIEFFGCGVTGIYARGGNEILKRANFEHESTTILDTIDSMVKGR